MATLRDTEMRGRRHALDTELTPALPDAQVRAAMAAFYKSNEGYALQQASQGVWCTI
jgi:hypothetical protein